MINFSKSERRGLFFLLLGKYSTTRQTKIPAALPDLHFQRYPRSDPPSKSTTLIYNPYDEAAKVVSRILSIAKYLRHIQNQRFTYDQSYEKFRKFCENKKIKFRPEIESISRMIFRERLLKLKSKYLDSGLHTSITDFLEQVHTLHNESRIGNINILKNLIYFSNLFLNIMSKFSFVNTCENEYSRLVHRIERRIDNMMVTSTKTSNKEHLKILQDASSRTGMNLTIFLAGSPIILDLGIEIGELDEEEKAVLNSENDVGEAEIVISDTEESVDSVELFKEQQETLQINEFEDWDTLNIKQQIDILPGLALVEDHQESLTLFSECNKQSFDDQEWENHKPIRQKRKGKKKLKQKSNRKLSRKPILSKINEISEISSDTLSAQISDTRESLDRRSFLSTVYLATDSLVEVTNNSLLVETVKNQLVKGQLITEYLESTIDDDSNLKKDALFSAEVTELKVDNENDLKSPHFFVCSEITESENTSLLNEMPKNKSLLISEIDNASGLISMDNNFDVEYETTKKFLDVFEENFVQTTLDPTQNQQKPQTSTGISSSMSFENETRNEKTSILISDIGNASGLISMDRYFDVEYDMVEKILDVFEENFVQPTFDIAQNQPKPETSTEISSSISFQNETRNEKTSLLISEIDNASGLISMDNNFDVEYETTKKFLDVFEENFVQPTFDPTQNQQKPQTSTGISSSMSFENETRNEKTSILISEIDNASGLISMDNNFDVEYEITKKFLDVFGENLEQHKNETKNEGRTKRADFLQQVRTKRASEETQESIYCPFVVLNENENSRKYSLRLKRYKLLLQVRLDRIDKQILKYETLQLLDNPVIREAVNQYLQSGYLSTVYSEDEIPSIESKLRRSETITIHSKDENPITTNKDLPKLRRSETITIHSKDETPIMTTEDLPKLRRSETITIHSKDETPIITDEGLPKLRRSETITIHSKDETPIIADEGLPKLRRSETITIHSKDETPIIADEGLSEHYKSETLAVNAGVENPIIADEDLLEHHKSETLAVDAGVETPIIADEGLSEHHKSETLAVDAGVENPIIADEDLPEHHKSETLVVDTGDETPIIADEDEDDNPDVCETSGIVDLPEYSDIFLDENSIYNKFKNTMKHYEQFGYESPVWSEDETPIIADENEYNFDLPETLQNPPQLENSLDSYLEKFKRPITQDQVSNVSSINKSDTEIVSIAKNSEENKSANESPIANKGAFKWKSLFDSSVLNSDKKSSFKLPNNQFILNKFRDSHEFELLSDHCELMTSTESTDNEKKLKKPS